MTKTATASPIIDSQVHAYEANNPRRPWVGTLAGPPAVTGEALISAMQTVGVDGALLVSPWSMYRYDASYALEVYAKSPRQFALIKPFDYGAFDVGEQIEAWARTPGSVGARIVLLDGASPDANNLGVNQLLKAAAAHALPVNILCWGQLELFASLARRHPNTQLVLDHLGLLQPFEPPVPTEPFAKLADVLALAQYNNVAIKISGACTLSHEAFPFRDIWPALDQIFEAFGLQRCLWGTDWTRAVNFLTYKQGVDAFQMIDKLSADERAMLMGGALQRIYNWAPQTSDSTTVGQ